MDRQIKGACAARIDRRQTAEIACRIMAGKQSPELGNLGFFKRSDTIGDDRKKHALNMHRADVMSADMRCEVPVSEGSEADIKYLTRLPVLIPSVVAFFE